MRNNRTYRVRESALKAYYYLRATFKIESGESESFVFEQIMLEGLEKFRELTSQNKNILIGHYTGKRYTIGGNMDVETINEIVSICKENRWQVQECVEVLIYFSALNRFTEQEQQFFGLDNWKIAIL